MASKKSQGSVLEYALSIEEQKTKINEIRKLLGPITDRMPILCSDASISRYLRARNWNTKKACKMLKDTLKWRLDYRPENIRWEDVAHEAKVGKVYKANYLDKYGRIVLVMRPGVQSTSPTKEQIRYLVYCMENAIMSMTPDQEQMVWLIDFHGWNMSSISVKVTRETAHILQDHYPERLGPAVLYNPPKIFESFWAVVKPVLEHRTYKKAKFIYSEDPKSQKIMEGLFNMEKLESTFGGQNPVGFDYDEYSKRMKEDERKILDSSSSGCSKHISYTEHPESLISDLGSVASDEGSSSSDEAVCTKFGDSDDTTDGKRQPNLGDEEVQKISVEASEREDTNN